MNLKDSNGYNMLVFGPNQREYLQNRINWEYDYPHIRMGRHLHHEWASVKAEKHTFSNN